MPALVRRLVVLLTHAIHDLEQGGPDENSDGPNVG
jgi:hypothetical protein